MFVRQLLVTALALVAPFSATAATSCDQVLASIGANLTNVTCFASPELPTNHPATTPANNTLVATDGVLLPAGAWTPQTDRSVISPSPPNRTPITKVVPGIQLAGYLADDPSGEARFLLRLPDDWNGKLVVAGEPGTRSEFGSDFVWSDYVVQQGYAYASQNKGVLNLKIVSLSSPTPPDSLSCRLNPASQVWVDFYDNAPDKPFTQWTQNIIEAGQLAREGVKARYNHYPRRTYAVGTSNGGYQVRRAIEEAPNLFDGGVDWEGTFIDPNGPNVLVDLPHVLANFPAYVASGYDPNSKAAQNILAAGYPPDIVNHTPTGVDSLWGRYNGSFWEVTTCQWQKRFDPSYDTYVSGLANYDYLSRLNVP